MTKHADAKLPVAPSPPRTEVASSMSSLDLVRCGAELVELSERFYRGIFVAGVIFVGMAGIAALALLPLRQSDATYTTSTVAITGLLVVVVPIVVWQAGATYQLLRRRQEAQFALVLLSAALVIYPLRSELWWPSCALLMLLANFASLRRILTYCLLVLLANLAAHLVAGDLDETPPVTIIGLWVGYVFWSSAFAIFIDRLAANVLRVNRRLRRRQSLQRSPPLRVRATQSFVRRPPVSHDPADRLSIYEDVADPVGVASEAIGRLTARQLQVVALLSDGLRYDEVAACLAISVRQVQRHVSNAVSRLGLRNANELVAVAVADGTLPDRSDDLP